MPKRRARRAHPRPAGPVRAAMRVPLRESATVAERTELRESVARAITGAPADADGGLLLDMQIMRSGWNNSGTKYYPPQVVARDIPTVLGEGTHCHIDHPGATEAVERPERSLQTLAAVIAEKPYSPDDGKTLRAKVRVYGPYAPFIREAWRDIGVSINADGVAHYGEAEGRKGLIVDEVTVGKSVDFVTRAGAGGKILALLESAREVAAAQPAPDDAAAQPVQLREARNVGGWLESRLHLSWTELCDDLYGSGRLTREERMTLSGAIGDGLKAVVARVQAEASQLFERDLWEYPPEQQTTAVTEALRLREATSEEVRRALDAVLKDAYGAEDVYVYVRDYDADAGLVWFEVNEAGGWGLWQQAYTVADEAIALAGERVEAVSRTVYEVAGDGGAAVVESDPGPSTTSDVADGAEPSADENAPGSVPDTTPEKEGAMPDDPTAEVKAREAAEAARVQAETERDTALREAADAKTRLARYEAVETARPLVTTTLAESELPAAARARVLASTLQRVPLTDAGTLDEAGLRTLLEAETKAETAYLASLAEAAGAGQVRGAGNTTTPAVFNPAPIAPQPNAALVEAYRARGMDERAASLAASGRPA